MQSHQEKIQAIAAEIKAVPAGAAYSLKKRVVSHTVPNTGGVRTGGRIDVSTLNEILEIDARNKICVAEPGITFSELVRATLPHGLVPFCVPELKTITIGGAVSGCSVESMSYKYGGFHDSCTEYEVITGTGGVITCSRERNTEIFEMMHGSFGTLGIISKLTFKLTEAKPFVHLTFERYPNLAEYAAAIRVHYEKRDADFMDGIIHDRGTFTLCVGSFVPSAPYTHAYDERSMPYYRATRERTEDYLSTHDYFFRYDSDCHWIARNYGLENPILRRLLGKFFLSSTKLLTLAKKFGFLFAQAQPDVIVDVFVPFSRFADFWSFYEREFNYFPVWVVPYKIARRYPWIADDYLKGVPDELFIDLAIYGMRQRGRNYYKLLEDELLRVQGMKTLISHNSYDKETFWKIYNKPNYERVKRITDPNNLFRDVYKKTHRRRI